MIKKAFHDITNVSKRNIKLTIYKSSHRKKLIRWLYEVTHDFVYSQSTFGIAVYILDTYTQKNSFELSNYQLLGLTALFIAAKLDEQNLKSISDYVAVTDNLVTPKEILETEKEILLNTEIQFNIPHSYLKKWYLEKMQYNYTTIECREILFCCFACVMEKSNVNNNMYWIYLEGIRQAEGFLTRKIASEDLKFYLNNNFITKNLCI